MRLSTVVALLLAGLATGSGVTAGETGEAWRLSPAVRQGVTKVLHDNAAAIVTAEFSWRLQVAKEGQTGQTADGRVTTNATVVDASGLTITSREAANPASRLPGAVRRRVAMTAELEGVRLLLAEHRSVPARVVFEDAQLDLIVLAPAEPVAPCPHVNINPDAEAGLLDPVILPGRLDAALGRAGVVRLGRIEAVIEAPRRYYLTGPSSPGLPVFDLRGRCLGFFLHQRVGETAGPGRGLVLPAPPLHEILKQLRAASSMPPANTEP